MFPLPPPRWTKAATGKYYCFIYFNFSTYILVTDIINITKKVKTSTSFRFLHILRKGTTNTRRVYPTLLFSKFSPEYLASNNYSITFILSIQKPFDLAFLHAQTYICRTVPVRFLFSLHFLYFWEHVIYFERFPVKKKQKEM